MHNTILLKISRHYISLWYSVEGERPAPLMIQSDQRIPLNFYADKDHFEMGLSIKNKSVGHDSNFYSDYFELIKDSVNKCNIYGENKPIANLLLYGIEQVYREHLAGKIFKAEPFVELFKNVYSIRFWFTADIPEEDQLLVKCLFGEAGYKDIDIVSVDNQLNSFLSARFDRSKSRLILNVLSDDLYLRLYKAPEHTLSAQKIIQGHGIDPRVEILANLILNDVKTANPTLVINEEKERPGILNRADFLIGNLQPLMLGSFKLTSGDSVQYRIRQRDLTERMMFKRGIEDKVIPEIENLFGQNQLESTQTEIFLLGDKTNSDYIRKSLSRKFPTVVGIDQKAENELFQAVFQNLKNAKEDLIANQEEDRIWQEVKETDTKGGYETYIRSYSRGRYISQARKRIDEISSLEKEAISIAREKEDKAWQKAKELNTSSSYKSYIRVYSEGRYLSQAESILTEIKEEERQSAKKLEEERVWEEVKRRNVKVGYESYLKEYPEGFHVKEARIVISAIENQEKVESPIKKDSSGTPAPLPPKKRFQPPVRKSCISRGCSCFGYSLLFLLFLFAVAIGLMSLGVDLERFLYKLSDRVELFFDDLPFDFQELSHNDNNLIEEEESWEIAINNGTIEAFQSYLGDYPEGRFVEVALLKLSEIESNEDFEKNSTEMQIAWEAAIADNSIASYFEFLQRFPKGRYTVEANSQIKSIEEKLNKLEIQSHDTTKWTEALSKNTKDSFNEYLRLYPNSYYAPEARLKFKNLEVVEQIENLEEKEKLAWEKVASENRINSYGDYLKEYPEGRVVEQVKSKIKKLKGSPLAGRSDHINSEKSEQINLNTSAEKAAHEIASTMIRIPGGIFNMGCTNEQISGHCEKNEKPVHQVRLSGFFINKYEVTQEQYAAIMGSNPSHNNNNCPRCPVENVSWDNVLDFIERLNNLTGKNYRLPSEAEWEYAARGGENFRYAGSDNIHKVARSRNHRTKLHPVGSKSPNGYGLYDMSGNVEEWCKDWYASYSSEPKTNPRGPSTGSHRVVRGGSYLSYARHHRVSSRSLARPSDHKNDRGFRLVF